MVMRSLVVVALCAAAGSTIASGQVVFNNGIDNGYFTPFTSQNAATVRYGDSGWLSGPGSQPFQLTGITLRLAVDASSAAGTTDLTFTFNNGDPSGLVFGPGTTLFSTTITNVQLPDSSAGPQFFNVFVPLPNVQTSGNFNNIGWSIGTQNFNYNGRFGFQLGSANSQFTGFYTNNASFFDGSSWSLFSFGPDPVFGVANYSVQVTGAVVPAPAAAALMGIAGIAAGRRRRSAR